MRVAFDRLVKPDGTIQLPLTCAGQVVTVLLPDLQDQKGTDLETVRQVARLEQERDA